MTAREFAVDNFQFVGIHIVKSVSLLEIVAEVGKSAREYRSLVAGALEHLHHAVDPFGDGEVLGNLAHHALVEPFEQSHALAETFAEINLSAHGAFGDGFYLIAYTGTHGQLVYDLSLDESRVHIEAY